MQHRTLKREAERKEFVLVNKCLNTLNKQKEMRKQIDTERKKERKKKMM